MSDWFDAGKDNAYYERKLREFGWVRGDGTLGWIPRPKLDRILREFYPPSVIEQLNQPLILPASLADKITKEPGQIIEYRPL